MASFYDRGCLTCVCRWHSERYAQIIMMIPGRVSEPIMISRVESCLFVIPCRPRTQRSRASIDFEFENNLMILCPVYSKSLQVIHEVKGFNILHYF